jgi:UDP-glucuronate 4-epimerase
MALFLFTQAMLAHKPIDVFNHGKMIRDFTYIDDIVEGVVRCVDKPAIPSVEADLDYKDPSQSDAPFLVFNIGNSHPTPLMDYIKALEEALDIEAQKNYLPMQAGDVLTTSADVSKLASWIDFKPNTPVKVGVKKFADWYRAFYGV